MMLEVQQAFSHQFPALIMNEKLCAYINTAWLSEIADALFHSWGLCVMCVCLCVCQTTLDWQLSREISKLDETSHVSNQREAEKLRVRQTLINYGTGLAREGGVKWGIGRVMRDDDDEMIGWGLGCSDCLRQPIGPPERWEPQWWSCLCLYC